MPTPYVFVPAPGVASVEVIATRHGSIVENRFNVLFDAAGGALDQTTADRIHTVAATWVTGQYVPQCDVGTLFNQMKIRDLGSLGGAVYAYVLNNSGSVTPASQLPNNVTVAIQHHTSRSGRRYRGRSYVIGLHEVKISGDQMSGTWPTTYVNVWGNLRTSLLAATPALKLVVVSRMKNKAYLSTAEISEVTSFSIDPNLDSQRRRLAGRGK